MSDTAPPPASDPPASTSPDTAAADASAASPAKTIDENIDLSAQSLDWWMNQNKYNGSAQPALRLLRL